MYLNIEFKNVTFGYNQKELVFEQNSLKLNVSEKEKYYLYGIIGSSGTGKTTFINILGGQLKPEGQVLVQGFNVYEIYDADRQKLICFQMQTSNALRGSLKYNLTFGLPRGLELYSDEDLIKTLQDVGLWDIFKGKEGLDTLIGEGGLNLSGGQRQRLSFAGIYLRSKYYKPKLILIDEPTSSLDELSELAITKMINDLANHALTLVVAHRLKTLDSAVGILDISTLQPRSELKFLPKNELKQASKYYSDLIDGKAKLEE
jgi:ABC-type multidrug transport system fused ATPase/permease subunit